MIEEGKQEKGRETYNTLCEVLSNIPGFRSTNDSRKLTIKGLYIKKDYTTLIDFIILPESELVLLEAPLRLFPQIDRIYALGVATCIASKTMYDGCFDFDFGNSRIIYKITYDYSTNPLNAEVINYMLDTTFLYYDNFNTPLIYVNQNKMTINEMLNLMEPKEDEFQKYLENRYKTKKDLVTAQKVFEILSTSLKKDCQIRTKEEKELYMCIKKTINDYEYLVHLQVDTNHNIVIMLASLPLRIIDDTLMETSMIISRLNAFKNGAYFLIDFNDGYVYIRTTIFYNKNLITKEQVERKFDLLTYLINEYALSLSDFNAGRITYDQMYSCLF